MPFDADYIALLRALPAVDTLCVGKKIYHEEVLQTAGDDFTNYPCLAYTILSDNAFRLLDGTSTGIRVAIFIVNCYSRSTADTRALAAAVQGVCGVFDDAGDIEVIEPADTSDEFNPPIDFDVKGMKAAQVTAAVTYREPE